MEAALQAKIDEVRRILAGYGSVLVALSGGVDSSLLLCLAREALGDRAAAATARSVLNPPGDLELSARLAEDLGVRRLVLDFDPLNMEEVRRNRRDRCYHCKLALCRRLLDRARDEGYLTVVEGSHAEDGRGYRPGRRAVEETGLKSPLAEAGLTKADIRAAARELGLPQWNRPSQACLATRFPYDAELTPELLGLVFRTETVLAEFGLGGARARLHGRLLRLEVPADRIEYLTREETRRPLLARLDSLGFDFVTLDLAGYRSGVFDPKENG